MARPNRGVRLTGEELRRGVVDLASIHISTRFGEDVLRELRHQEHGDPSGARSSGSSSSAADELRGACKTLYKLAERAALEGDKLGLTLLSVLLEAHVTPPKNRGRPRSPQARVLLASWLRARLQLGKLNNRDVASLFIVAGKTWAPAYLNETITPSDAMEREVELARRGLHRQPGILDVEWEVYDASGRVPDHEWKISTTAAKDLLRSWRARHPKPPTEKEIISGGLRTTPARRTPSLWKTSNPLRRSKQKNRSS